MNKCIRMGITASNLSFGEVNRRFYGSKLRFTAPLTRRRKTKFPTVKPPIYLPKCQIWKQLSPNYHQLQHHENSTKIQNNKKKITVKLGRESFVFLLAVSSLNNSLTNMTVRIPELSLWCCCRHRNITFMWGFCSWWICCGKVKVVTKDTVCRRENMTIFTTLSKCSCKISMSAGTVTQCSYLCEYSNFCRKDSYHERKEVIWATEYLTDKLIYIFIH